MSDLIDRQAAIDALRQQAETMSEWSNRYAEQRKGVLTAANIVEDLPSAQPEQRTGHWIPVGVTEVVGGETAQWGSAVAYHKCSECDEQALRDDFEQEVLSKWCPNCGAKMVGVEE